MWLALCVYTVQRTQCTRTRMLLCFRQHQFYTFHVHVQRIFSTASFHWCVGIVWHRFVKNQLQQQQQQKMNSRGSTSSKITSYAIHFDQFHRSTFSTRQCCIYAFTAYVIRIYVFEKRATKSPVNWKVDVQFDKQARRRKKNHVVGWNLKATTEHTIRNWLTYHRHLIWLHVRCFPLHCSLYIGKDLHHRSEHVWYSNGW